MTSSKHDEVVKRVKAANKIGTNITRLSRDSGVSRFRLYLWIGGKEYQQNGRTLKSKPFNDEEVEKLNVALDNVKAAM